MLELTGLSEVVATEAVSEESRALARPARCRGVRFFLSGCCGTLTWAFYIVADSDGGKKGNKSSKGGREYRYLGFSYSPVRMSFLILPGLPA